MLGHGYAKCQRTKILQQWGEVGRRLLFKPPSGRAKSPTIKTAKIEIPPRLHPLIKVCLILAIDKATCEFYYMTSVDTERAKRATYSTL